MGGCNGLSGGGNDNYSGEGGGAMRQDGDEAAGRLEVCLINGRIKSFVDF